MKTFDESREIGAVNAALMVVRKIVETGAPDDTEMINRVETRARFCQVLARRLKLTPIQSHRIALAAWLSALEGKAAVARQIAEEHNLNDVLFPSGSEEGLKYEARILATVKGYEVLKTHCPEDVENPAEAVRYLERVLPADKDQKHLLRLFRKVLEDELFLTGGRAGSGRILIVDPEEAVSPVLSPPLTSDGYKVRVVPTVEAARAILKEFKPHLVLAEMAMPVVDGLEFCKETRLNEETSDITFIMLTKSKGPKTHAKCLKAGADEVLTRPVDLEMLFLRLRRMIKKPDAEKPASSDGVSGSLSDMPFSDIIQIVTAGGRSMEIVLTRESEEGVVFIQNGEILHAAVGDVEGEVAFFRLMRWAEGSFVTRQCNNFDKRTIQGTVMGLLMEGARRNDEGLLPDESS